MKPYQNRYLMTAYGIKRPAGISSQDAETGSLGDVCHAETIVEVQSWWKVSIARVILAISPNNALLISCSAHFFSKETDGEYYEADDSLRKKRGSRRKQKAREIIAAYGVRWLLASLGNSTSTVTCCGSSKTGTVILSDLKTVDAWRRESRSFDVCKIHVSVPNRRRDLLPRRKREIIAPCNS